MMEVGGVFGSLLNEISVSMCGFEGSLNTKSSGIITAEDVGADYYYAHYVGGFCGSAGRANSDITVKNCYAKADIVCQTDNGLQDAGLFAGGKGFVHDNGLYQNLVSSGSIKAIRKGKTKKEYAFWAGESGFANNYDASTCKNCIVLKDGTAVVTGRAYQKEPVEKTYSLEKTTLAELLCGKLGFSEKSWKINGNAFPEFSVCFLHKKAYCTSCGIKACSKHTYKTTTTKATLTKNGGTVKRCTVCGKEASKTVVYYPKTIKLSATTYNYDGKVKTPSVVVKDADGKTLKKGTDYKVTYAGGRKKVGAYKVTVTMMGKYTGSKTLTFKIQKVNISKCTVKLSDTVYTYNGKTKTPTVKVQSPDGKTLKKGTDYKVTYASGRKKVGTYKVTVTMMGKYTGSKTLTFKIIPRAASINKLTAKSKQITVKLNRSLQQSTGYEVQYSTAKTFKSAKKAVVKSYKTSSVVLSGLKAKATYYVRVRTYKTVNGVKYYSNWSNYKQIKTK